MTIMTSQKRYRHHQDGNGGGTRFRDLPPRFKRQKSSSSPTQSPNPATPVHEVHINSRVSSGQPLSEKAEFQQSAPFPVIPSTHQVEDKVIDMPAQFRSKTNGAHTPVTVIEAAPWNGPQNTVSVYAMPPQDSPSYKSIDSPPPYTIPLGTHFGFKPTSPPLSPWPERVARNFPVQNSLSVSPSWQPAHVDAFTSPTPLSSPSGFNNENMAPIQNVHLHQTPDVQWCKSPASFQHYQNSTSPPIHSQGSHLSAKANADNSMDAQSKQSAIYSDPDLRTIEMLKELERVADQKESEGDDFGTDRKSLVSHHLRMLMCAVDRYTEGIEDMLPSGSRQDEAASAPNSPVPIREVQAGHKGNWPQTVIKDALRSITPETSTALWSPAQKSPMRHRQVATPVTSPITSPQIPVQVPVMISSPAAVSSMWGNVKNMGYSNTAAWDLWSSPSFDFTSFLTSYDSENLILDPFGRRKESERKPLYLR